MELLERRQLLSGTVVGFEDSGDLSSFAYTRVLSAGQSNAPLSWAAGNDGHVMRLGYTHHHDGVKFSPSGDDYLLSNGTISVDARLRYYGSTGSGANGTVPALILKQPSPASNDAYMVTLDQTGGTIRLMIGAAKDIGGSREAYKYYGPSAGHSAYASIILSGYTPILDNATHDLGWYTIAASISGGEGGSPVTITAKVTASEGTSYYGQWSDTGSAAWTGTGMVGIAQYSQWSQAGEFDNFTVDDEVTLFTPPVVGIEANIGSVNEGSITPGAYTLRRTGSTAGDLRVNVAIHGTAGMDDLQDYTLDPLPGGLGDHWYTIPAGQDHLEIALNAGADNLVEGDESSIIQLLPGSSYTFGGSTRAGVTVVDDPPTVSISTASASPLRAGGQEQIIVTRTGGGSTQELRVRVNLTGPGTANSIDGSGYATIPANSSDVTITVTATEPRGDEGETITLALSEPGFEEDYVVDTEADSASIEVAAVPVFAIESPIPFAYEESGSAGEFTVRLVAGTVLNDVPIGYTVTGTADGGDDYALLSGTVTYSVVGTSATIEIDPTQDGSSELFETVIVTLNSPTETFPSYLVREGEESATVTIADRAIAEVSVTAIDTEATEELEADDVATFLLHRKGDFTQPLTVGFFLTPGDIGWGTYGIDFHLRKVDLSTGAGSTVLIDPETLSGEITFGAGAGDARIDLVPIDDTDLEGTEQIALTLSQPPEDEGGEGEYPQPLYLLSSQPSALFALASQVEGEGAPKVSIAAADPDSTDAVEEYEASRARYRVSRAVAGRTDLAVYVTAGGQAEEGLDFTRLDDAPDPQPANVRQVVIRAGQREAFIEIDPIDDSRREDAENFVLTLVQDQTYEIDANRNQATGRITERTSMVIEYVEGTDSGNATREAYKVLPDRANENDYFLKGYRLKLTSPDTDVQNPRWISLLSG